MPYSDLLNTKFPWLFVLIGGYLPAISEEFVFRMFAIPFLRKVVRWLPAAVVLAAFTWGFGHAGYAQQPFFIRGVEVGIGGVALGIIMLRWGILPTLVWHYSVDAMYSAMLLLRSHSLYFRLSGAASAGIFVLPILVALVAYWRKGGFEPETGLLNGDEPAPAEVPMETAAPVAAPVHGYQRLTGRMRLVAIAIFAGGMLTALIPVHNRFGESPGYKLTPDQAQASSDAFLRAEGIDPAAYKHITFPEARWGGDDSLTAKYFLEHAPVSAASKLFEKNRPLHVWATRYFKPLDKEEFLLTVQPETGVVVGYLHEIPEDRAGADLPTDTARPIAAAFASTHGFDVSAMDLKESDSEKKKARRDYTLVWEARSGDGRNLDEAHYRLAIDVDGDRAASMRSYWKLPETFKRSRDRQNFISIGVLAITIGFVAGGIVFGLWVLIRQIRKGLVPWRRSLLWAIIPAAMTVVSLVLSLHLTLYRGYQTSIPFETFAITTGAVLLIGVAFAYVMYVAASAVLLSFFPGSFSAMRLSQRRALGLDAFLLLLLAIGLWHLCHQLGAILMDRFHTLAILEVDTPTLIGLPAPAIAALSGALRSVFSQAAMLAVATLALWKLPKRWMLAPLLLLAAATTVSSDVRTVGEFALEYAQGFAAFGSALLFCFWFARDNYLAYALVLVLGALHPALAELLHSANPALVTQGWIVAGFLLAALAWAVLPGMVKTRYDGEHGTIHHKDG